MLIRDVLGKFEPRALLSTNLGHTPEEMLRWFVRWWTMKVTFEKARSHLGIETQRRWNDSAIERTTPALFGFYSIVALVAQTLIKNESRAIRTAAWYIKERPTFSDAIAVVGRHLWKHCH